MEATDINLKRVIGLPSGISLIVGGIIGSGIFVSPQGVLAGAGSYGLSLIIWVLCGVISLCGALTYAEMGTRIPKSGSAYYYLMSIYGDWAAFVYMFTWIFFSLPSAVCIVALTCSEYFIAIFFTDNCGAPPENVRKLFAAALIISVAVINIYSVTTAGKIAVTFTAAKLIALAIIILGGLISLGKGNTDYLHPDNSFKSTTTSVSGVAEAMLSGMWAYAGWDSLNYITEELKNPLRTLPLSILIAIPSVTMIYLLTNMAYFSVLSPEEVLSSTAVAVTWADKLIPKVSWFIPLAVSASTFGTTSGAILLNSRLPFVAAREDHMLQILSMIHIKYLTPIPSIILMSCLAVIYLNLGTVLELIGFIGIAGWIFDGMVAVGVLILRRKPAPNKSIFKVPLICPIILLLFAVFLSLGPIIGDPQFGYFFALAVVFTGLLCWLIVVKLGFVPPGLDNVTMVIQMLLMVSPADKEMKTNDEQLQCDTKL